VTEIVLVAVGVGSALWCIVLVVLALFTEDAAKKRDLAGRLESLAALLAQHVKALKAGESKAKKIDEREVPMLR
jgi:predicted metal-binding membrane protein